MLELFLNPVNMVVGGALISSPIIIHLINRMRYKRVRWAAMEFLLKSQKRNRRRLIIEQLILLLLRILLVLLAGLLLARFLGLSSLGNLFGKPKNGLHVVIFNDGLSMTDHWKDRQTGEKRTAFDVARQRVELDIGKQLLQATSPQRLVVRRLSEANKPADDSSKGDTAGGKPFTFDKRMSDETLRELHETMDKMEPCSLQHLSLVKGLDEAAEVFRNARDDDRYLYLVSDFRQRHWGEPEANELTNKVNELKNQGIHVRLVDVADPPRPDNAAILPLYHDNLAVADLRSETRVAAETMPVQFTVRVANHSPSERKSVRVTVKVDGIERPEGSLTIPSIPANKTDLEKTFQVAFVRPANLPPDQPYFAQITANLENEEVGLDADNFRYAVVEVRRQVPVLIVDGDLSNGDKPGGDTFHVRAVLSSARGFDVRARTPVELEQPNLDQYPSIYLVNVPNLSQKAQKNLERYVKNGGSVAFFMGERVNADFYNKLYAKGQGLFPVPLADRPTRELSEQEKAEKDLQNLLNPQQQIYVRDADHPIFKEFGRAQHWFRYLNIDRYYPVPRTRWDDRARRANQVEELATLPNDRPVSEYDSTVRALLKDLKTDDPKYGPSLKAHAAAVEAALGGKAPQALAAALGELLTDEGKAPEGPDAKATPANLKEYWDQPDADIQAMRSRIEKLRDTVAYGDPLVVAGHYGKGRTVVFLTTAGTKWNTWGGGSLSSPTYPVVMIELQKYLTSEATDTDLTVGQSLVLDLDGTRYQAKMSRYRLLDTKEAGAKKPAAGAETGAQRSDLEYLGDQSGTEKDGRVTFRFQDALRPGTYVLALELRPDQGGAAKKEWRAYAYNVDAKNESDLRRFNTQELVRFSDDGKVVGVGATPVPALKQTDLSESAVFYLVFLLILVAEQAMAVHLSFHLRGSEAALPAQALKRAA
jgi:hypothetical protein